MSEPYNFEKASTKKWDASEYLDSPEMIREYLKAVIDEGDPESLMIAIANVAKAKGMTEITPKTNKVKTYGPKELERDYGPLTFGRALWAYRKCEEITQKDFARFLDLSTKALRNIEKGRRIPSPVLAAKIAKQLGQSERLWIQLVFQDMLREARLDYLVKVEHNFNRN